MQNRRRSPNGENISGKVLLVFDLDDPLELAAFQRIQKLTARRKLKPLIMGIFGAISDIEDQTGREMTPDQITISLLRSAYLGGGSGGQSVSIRNVVIEDDDDALPAPFMGSGLEADPSEVRRQLSESLADEFDDF